MGIDAKPPVRRGPGAGLILVLVLGAVFCVPVVIGTLLMAIFGFARSAPQPAHIVVSSTYASHSDAYPVSVSPEFEARLSAANRIQVSGDRDEALAILAAAFASNTEEANQAIRAIQTSDMRDTAAWNAARRFSETNRPQESIVVIENVLDQSTRDAAFRAVATGRWPERPGDEADATGVTPGMDSYTTTVAEAATR